MAVALLLRSQPKAQRLRMSGSGVSRSAPMSDICHKNPGVTSAPQCGTEPSPARRSGARLPRALTIFSRGRNRASHSTFLYRLGRVVLTTKNSQLPLGAAGPVWLRAKGAQWKIIMQGPNVTGNAPERCGQLPKWQRNRNHARFCWTLLWLISGLPRRSIPSVRHHGFSG